MNKRAQAALEFLMTYGWAILVVLAAIGALAYFGVLNPGNFLPNKCVATPGVSCVEKPVVTLDGAGAGDDVLLQTLTNNLGFGLTAAQYTVALGPGFVPTTCVTATTFLCARGQTAACAANEDWDDSEQLTLVVDCDGTGAGTSIKGDVLITFTNPNSGLAEVMRVGVTGK